MSKRRNNERQNESRSLVDVTLACGHHERVQMRDLPHIATVTPAPPLTRWEKIRRRKPRPVIASDGLFVTCNTCDAPHPVVK